MVKSRQRLWIILLLISACLLPIIPQTKPMPFDLSNEDSLEEMENEENAPTDAPVKEVHLFQGDIVLDTNDDRVAHQGVLEEATWPNGIVPYLINPKFNDSSKQMIKAAMKVIESYSCIKFRQKNGNDQQFIRFTRKGSGHCSSKIGMSYEDKYENIGQPLRLDEACTNHATILHELMHALGFHHEQSRTDRDQFVEIHFNNIPEDRKEEFEKTTDPDVTHLGTAYDYYSIMHYQWNAFAKDKRKPTISIRQDGIDSKILGTGYNLSSTDIIEINRLYNCPGYNNRQNTGAKLLIAQKNSITQLDIIASIPSRPVLNTTNNNIKSLAFDCQQQRVIWSDIGKDVVIYTSILYGSDDDRHDIRLEGKPDISYLNIDWSSRNLYFYNSNAYAIDVLSLNGKYWKTIVSLGRPGFFGGMTLDLHNRHLYFSLNSYAGLQILNSVIERTDLEGKYRTVLLNRNHSWNKGLVILQERRKICWIAFIESEDKNQISCISLDERNQRISSVPMGMRYKVHLYGGFTVLGERFYWGGGDNQVHSVTIDGSDYKSFPSGSSGGLQLLAAMPENCDGVESECAVNNGGCPYLCLPKTGGNVSCVCPDNAKNLEGC